MIERGPSEVETRAFIYLALWRLALGFCIVVVGHYGRVRGWGMR